jgi:tRNA (cmo5U34)-methyltransferase
MSTNLESKSTVEEIRQRFDKEVERFSNHETGQRAAMDAPLILELVAQTAGRCLRGGNSVLDLGCGAGNFTVHLLKEVEGLDCHLVDLSLPMLACAEKRVSTIPGLPAHNRR